jgi:hypothetical protein
MGNASSLVYDAQFLQAWPKRGTLLHPESSAIMASLDTSIAQIVVRRGCAVDAVEGCIGTGVAENFVKARRYRGDRRNDQGTLK